MVWEGVMIAFHVWELFLFPCEGAKSILEAIPDEANTKELNQLLSPALSVFNLLEKSLHC